jgi:2-phosphoglycolate phosphatase
MSFERKQACHPEHSEGSPGVFFDLDGTLIDTAGDFVYSLNLLLKAHGQPKASFEAIRGTISEGSLGMVRTAFSHIQDPAILNELVGEFLDYYTANISRESCLFPGVDELLAFLNTEQIPWGIITNKSSFLSRKLLTELKLINKIPVLVCGDTLAVAKPDPLPLVYACEKVGADPKKSLYIGDAQRDIIAGNHAGMISLVALFGYLSPTDKPHNWNAHSMIHTSTEMLNWIKEWLKL